MPRVVGIQVVRSVLGTGEFHCPHCGGDRRYRRGAGRRRLAILGVPVLPLPNTGVRVECASCGNVFAPHVLEQPTGRRLTTLLREAHRAAVAGVLAAPGTAPGPAARAAGVEAVRAAGLASYTDEALGADLAAHRDHEARAALGALAVHLEPAGREHLLAVAAHVARAAGPLGDRERGYLHDKGGHLGLTRGQVDRVLDHAGNAGNMTP
jgi:predicted RNA-binding Zn-ribbon protein involved in translation (DUF1610 family)